MGNRPQLAAGDGVVWAGLVCAGVVCASSEVGLEGASVCSCERETPGVPANATVINSNGSTFMT